MYLALATPYVDLPSDCHSLCTCIWRLCYSYLSRSNRLPNFEEEEAVAVDSVD